jgi:5-methylcytosine-specific restriction protein A
VPWPTTSRQSRGYGSDWDKRRLRILERDGYLCQCAECKTHERTTGTPGLEASEVHHLVSKAIARIRGWTDEQIDDDSNLSSRNTECHKRETITANGGTPKPKRIIGLDGFPIEP